MIRVAHLREEEVGEVGVVGVGGGVVVGEGLVVAQVLDAQTHGH